MKEKQTWKGKHDLSCLDIAVKSHSKPIRKPIIPMSKLNHNDYFSSYYLPESCHFVLFDVFYLYLLCAAALTKINILKGCQTLGVLHVEVLLFADTDLY